MHPACVRPFEPYSWTVQDYDALRSAAGELGVRPEDLLLVLYRESGLNPRATHCLDKGYPNAVGLNQIVSSLLVPDKVSYLKLSVAEQLPTVVKYFKTQGKKTEGVDVVTLYQLNLAPATVPNEVIFRSDDPVHPEYYKWNSGLDFDHDGVITRSDLSQDLNAHAHHAAFKRALDELGGKVPIIPKPLPPRAEVGGGIALAAGAVLALGLFLKRR